MGRRPTWDELQAYQRVFGNIPVEIVMATGSYDVPGWTFALVPFVNKDNPLSKLTVEQLDGIFGAQRDGGWKGNDWDPSVARGPDKNIRTWGQLGLTGEWANKPIHVYGYNLNFHFPRDFADKVFGGGYKWNESMKEFSNRVRPPGSGGDFGRLWSAGDQMMDAVAADKYAITYTSASYRKKAGVKTVPLAWTAAGPYVYPTLDTVQDRTYPLIRDVYFYANRVGGKMDPLIAEYLRFIVSRQGQELVQKDGKYLPLTAEAARAQLAKLNERR
jgi:phosphate transport system substrate-binding protein